MKYSYYPHILIPSQQDVPDDETEAYNGSSSSSGTSSGSTSGNGEEDWCVAGCAPRGEDKSLILEAPEETHRQNAQKLFFGIYTLFICGVKHIICFGLYNLWRMLYKYYLRNRLSHFLGIYKWFTSGVRNIMFLNLSFICVHVLRRVRNQLLKI